MNESRPRLAPPTIAYDPANPAEYAAHVLMGFAGFDHWPWEREQQRLIVRTARGTTHPDAHAGNREHWDLVDWAVTVLDLHEKRAKP